MVRRALQASRRLKRLTGSSANARGIRRLITGQALAQVITFAFTPIVTRVYGPTDYASLALFSSVTAVAVAVATGRYDAAIPLPPETQRGERDALRLLAVAVGVSLLVCLTGMLCLLGAASQGANLWVRELGQWAYLLPLAVFLASVSQSLYQYGNRKRQYGRLSSITPASKIVTGALQVGLGVSGLGRTGLLLPVVLSPLVGSTILYRVLREGVLASGLTKRHLDWRSIKGVAATYRDFPLVATWIALINALNTSVQVLILAALFAPDDVGQYALAMALVSVPVSVIAGSVSSVYYREMASRQGDAASSLALTWRTLKIMVGVATPIVMLIGVVAIPLFPLLFGNQWDRAGHFATALLPWVWVRLIGIPLAAALAVCRRQAWQLAWQVTLLASFAASYYIGSSLGLDSVTCTWIASLSSVPLYWTLVPLVRRAIRDRGQVELNDSEKN